MFDNVLENIDENYPFSLSPKLILALLVSVGICVIALGVIFIWYKRKTTLTSSIMGNLVKLVPSLGDKVPTLNSLLPILSELTSSKTKTRITPTTVSPLPQTMPDELILPLSICSKASGHYLISINISYNPMHTPGLRTCLYKSKTKTDSQGRYYQIHASLEMFNRAASDLNTKGVINLKKYNRYLTKKTSKPV